MPITSAEREMLFVFSWSTSFACVFHFSTFLYRLYARMFFFVPSCHKSSRIPLNMGPIGGISGPKTSIFRHSYTVFSHHKCDRKSWIIFVSKGIHWTYYIVLNPLARQPKWLETASFSVWIKIALMISSGIFCLLFCLVFHFISMANWYK